MLDNSGLKDLIKKYPQVKFAARKLIATIPFSLRLGKEFWIWYTFFEESERWPESQIKTYQMDCLRTLLVKLAQTSEFYRDISF